MPIGWFVVPYKLERERDPTEAPNIRYCAMDDFTKEILADDGDWAETDIGNNQTIVKVVATQKTLESLGQTFESLKDEAAARTRHPTTRAESRFDKVSQTFKFDRPHVLTKSISKVAFQLEKNISRRK